MPTSPPLPTHSPTGKPKQRDAEATREKLLRAALECFSTQGYDASSTRCIEEAAGVKRGLISYHFGSKQALWEASAAYIMRVAGRELRTALAGLENIDAHSRPRYFVRAYVRYCARYPEVNRLMIQEAMRNDWRLTWLVKKFVSPWYQQVCTLFDEAKALGIAPTMEHHHFYYIFTGAATLIFSNAAEAKQLTGENMLNEEHINQHADVLANLLFPEKAS